MTPKPPLSRRRLLQATGVAAVALWVWGVPRLRNIWQHDTFTAIPGAAPFRALNGAGEISAANIALIGLGDPTDLPPIPDICRALFKQNATLSIAIFTDFNCPNCPGMEENVAAAAGETPIVTHQLPILGPASVTASRAAIAATFQGDDHGLRDALSRTRAITDTALVARLATDLGLDADRLLADMQSDKVDATLAQSAALRARLGIIGTPATVVGRTVILGTLPEKQIKRIIAVETAAGPPCQ